MCICTYVDMRICTCKYRHRSRYQKDFVVNKHMQPRNIILSCLIIRLIIIQQTTIFVINLGQTVKLTKTKTRCVYLPLNKHRLQRSLLLFRLILFFRTENVEYIQHSSEKSYALPGEFRCSVVASIWQEPCKTNNLCRERKRRRMHQS